MIRISDLTGIPEHKQRAIVKILDTLLTFEDPNTTVSSIITGYNWYRTLPKSDSIITFSNIHETEAYKQDMLRDLAQAGYDRKKVLDCIREKAGAFLHDLEFRIRDDKGGLLSGLKIKDARTGEYLDLTPYSEPLIKYPEFAESESYLIAEDQGWQIDMPFAGKEELLFLVDLFLKKSGEDTYNNECLKIHETAEQRKTRNAWTDAYKVPVLLLGETALRHSGELPQFESITKICLTENGNEISFVIHEKLGLLRKFPQYVQLLNLGFREEICLGNKPFIIQYVDKKR